MLVKKDTIAFYFCFRSSCGIQSTASNGRQLLIKLAISCSFQGGKFHAISVMLDAPPPPPGQYTSDIFVLQNIVQFA